MWSRWSTAREGFSQTKVNCLITIHRNFGAQLKKINLTKCGKNYKKPLLIQNGLTTKNWRFVLNWIASWKYVTLTTQFVWPSFWVRELSKSVPTRWRSFFFLETSETRFTRQVTVFPLHGQISCNSALVTRAFSFILGFNVSFLKLLFCIVL